MSVLQYVGARYVPLIYKNSAGTSEWQMDVAYEPLTIVEWQGVSYISRIPVPADAPAPAPDSTFWAAFGSFNGYLDNIAERVGVSRTVGSYSNMIGDTRIAIGDIVYTSVNGMEAVYIIGTQGPIKTANGYATPLNSELYVDMFGAVQSSTVGSDSAFKAGIEYCKSIGATLHLRGSYYITSPLPLLETAALVGHGTGNEYASTATIYCGVNPFPGEELTGIWIERIRFDGVNSTLVAFPSDAIYKWSTFKDCGFVHFAAVFTGQFLGTTFRDCWFDYNTTTGTMVGSDNSISGGFMNMNANSDYLLRLKNSFGLKMSGVYMTGINPGTNAGATNLLQIEDGCTGNIIRDCWMDNAYEYVINIAGTAAPNGQPGGTLISGCLLRGGGVSRNGGFISISYAQATTVVGCTFANAIGYSQPSGLPTLNIGIYPGQMTFLGNQYIYSRSIAGVQSGLHELGGYPYVSYDWGITLNRVGRIDTYTGSATTDSEYGAITLPVPEYYGNPFVPLVIIESGSYYACINAIADKSVQIIVRGVGGSPVLNTTVKYRMVVIG